MLANIVIFFRYDGYKQTPRALLTTGFGVSLWAGVAEEISFRWLIILGGIVSAPAIDYVLLGFAGFHPFQWVYSVLCSVANFFTFGYLHEYLLGSHGWAAAAAVLTSNGKFRDGHLYQGLRGITIAWFIGMYFFWIMFTYGLIASIVVHFVYDLCVFILVACDAMLEHRQVLMRYRRIHRLRRGTMLRTQ